ncbi:MAG: arsenite methyltransferase [Thermoleophilia bacterium]|jgi:SAM-dependent methyltransferase
MKDRDYINIQEQIRQAYGGIAKNSTDKSSDACGCGCGPADISTKIGYTPEDIAAVPEGANLGLGCGNPTAIAGLKPGEVVLDLGSGAGFDCFLAADRVGPGGRIIGIDMTPEMIGRAKENAAKSNVSNVEFRLGRIEELPVEDNSVDVVISNCVINLSADKPRVFQELYRVLKPGGRIAISDIALRRELPVEIRKSMDAWIGCVGEAILIEEYRTIVKDAGLKDIDLEVKMNSACIDPDSLDPVAKGILESLGGLQELDNLAVSMYITASRS